MILKSHCQAVQIIRAMGPVGNGPDAAPTKIAKAYADKEDRRR